MKGLVLFYSLTAAIAMGRVTSGQVELSSTLNGGSSCPNQPVKLQCIAYNSSLQSWVFPPFIPDNNPVTFDPDSEASTPVIRSDGGLTAEAVATEITPVNAREANITSTLSFQVSLSVNEKTVTCSSDSISESFTDSLSILVTDAVIMPTGFSCTSTDVNCEQSYMQFRCTWSQVVDSFNVTVSDIDGIIVQETFQSGSDENVEFPVVCNTTATVTVNAFRNCNLTTQTLTDITHLQANCNEACMDDNGMNPGLSSGAIAGIVIGTIIIVIIITSILTVAIAMVLCRRTVSNAWKRAKRWKFCEDPLEKNLKELNEAFMKQASSPAPENLMRVLRDYSDEQSEPRVARWKMYKYLSSIVRESSVNISGLESAEFYEFPYPLKNVLHAKFQGDVQYTQTDFPEVTFSQLAECNWPTEIVYPE